MSAAHQARPGDDRIYLGLVKAASFLAHGAAERPGGVKRPRGGMGEHRHNRSGPPEQGGHLLFIKSADGRLRVRHDPQDDTAMRVGGRRKDCDKLILA